MTEKHLSQVLREQMQTEGKRFWAGDNISEYVDEETKQSLINEATTAFEQVLDVLLIDRENDPNSQGTAQRLAKMYFNEIMAGRYEESPNATAFPNDTDGKYEGMLVVRSELKSMCSHHHQPVTGVAYIGILAGPKLIGLSKYTRIDSGVPDGALSKKNYVWILQEKLKRRLAPKTLAFIFKLPTVAVRIAVLWSIVVSPKPQFFTVHSRLIRA